MSYSYGVENKVYNFINDNSPKDVGEKERILVGLSGGADSVALLIILNSLKERLNIELFAVHVEHGIRGEESVRDMDFSIKFCERMGIYVRVFRENVPAISGENGLGYEEAARHIRYRDFKLAADEMGCDCVAVAHHANDQCETVLFHIVRGSSVSGAAGMRYEGRIEGMRIIRPLLCLKREEIERYLAEREEPFCVDSTNSKTEYDRNKLRVCIVPGLEKINPAAVRHINDFARDAGALSDYIEGVVEAEMQSCVQECEGESIVDLQKFETLHMVIKRGIIYNVIAHLRGKKKDITRKYVEEVLKISSGRTGAQVNLGEGICAFREYDRLILTSKRGNMPNISGEESGHRWMIDEGEVQMIEIGTLLCLATYVCLCAFLC